MKVEFDLHNVILEGIPDSIEKGYVLEKALNDTTSILQQHLTHQELLTGIQATFEREFIIKPIVDKSYEYHSVHKLFVAIYPYTNNSQFYINRRRIEKHFSYEDNDFHPRTNGLFIEVKEYLLDFKNIRTEEEKLFVFENCKKMPFFVHPAENSKMYSNVRITLDTDWIKENDNEFYKKYKLLFA